MPRPQNRPRLLAGIYSVLSLSLVLLLAGCQSFLFSKRPGEPERATNPCLVLALPASGPYAQIATKIKNGAETGRQELLKKGIQVRIENINTEEPDWLATLSALPPACAVVGGPLQEKAYLAARNAGLLQQRAFFTFMPTLQKGDEGKQAWRFFPGPQDQVDALIGFATDQMNMRTYGAFYPDDNYGRRMTEIMEQALRKRQIPFQKAAYSSGAPASWKSAVAPLVMPRRSEDGKTVVPQTMFEALFLPDSWKNMDMITSSLLYNGEDRLVLLGTTLWEQGLAGKQVPKAERYTLAVFPGAWNPAKAPAALKAANNDFWSALGYDFVNFGANVALAMRPEAALVTSRAQSAAASIHGLAPLYWDNDGVAHQRMYIFQVTGSGMTPLDPARFSQARAVAAERAALRMQRFSDSVAESGENTPEEAGNPPFEATAPPGPIYSTPAEPEASRQPPVEPAVAQPRPAQTTPGVMSSTPRPSYKLSLPIKK